MAFETTTGAYVSVAFDGKEYPLERNGLVSLAIVSNKKLHVPTCELVFFDYSSDVKRQPAVTDGSIMDIKEGLSTSRYNVWRFRVFSFRRESNKAPLYRVVGYPDCPNWFIGSWSSPFNNKSSHEVIAGLAKAGGLQYGGDNTNDRMTWLPSNKRICQFAREVSHHGWANDASCMSLGVTMAGKVLYKDLTKLPSSPERVFSFGDVPDSVRVFDVAYLGSSGYANTISAYKHSITTQNVHAAGNTANEVNAKKRAKTLAVNRDVRSHLGSARVDIADMNIGNTTDKYERGYYQNLRIASTYSIGVELLTDMMTDVSLDLFSPIMFDAREPAANGGDPKPFDPYIGVYWITAKCIYFNQGMRMEKFQAYSNGLNHDAVSSLL